jgi:cytidylate kinase
MVPGMTHLIIAIDGPAASGKGTLARNLAKQLGLAYLDTGALYRAVGKAVLDQGGNPAAEADAIAAANSLAANLKPEHLADPALRTDIVGQAASNVAKFPGVRDALFAFQQHFARTPKDGFSGVVLDGRDIGTVICPDAPVKLFITASMEERARRRHLELAGKGIETTYEAVLADMKERDARDSSRETAPLKPADDAYVLDTSAMSADEVLAKAVTIARSV